MKITDAQRLVRAIINQCLTFPGGIIPESLLMRVRESLDDMTLPRKAVSQAVADMKANAVLQVTTDGRRITITPGPDIGRDDAIERSIACVSAHVDHALPQAEDRMLPDDDDDDDDGTGEPSAYPALSGKSGVEISARMKHAIRAHIARAGSGTVRDLCETIFGGCRYDEQRAKRIRSALSDMCANGVLIKSVQPNKRGAAWHLPPADVGRADAARVLENYSRWRRGVHDDMPSPTDIGVALDVAIAALMEAA